MTAPILIFLSPLHFLAQAVLSGQPKYYFRCLAQRRDTKEEVSPLSELARFPAWSPAPPHWDQMDGQYPNLADSYPNNIPAARTQTGLWEVLGDPAFSGSSGVLAGTRTTSPAEAGMLRRFAWRQHP